MAVFQNGLVDLTQAGVISQLTQDLDRLRNDIVWLDNRAAAWEQISSAMLTDAPPAGLGFTTAQANFILAAINDFNNFHLLAHGSTPVNIDDATFNIKNLLVLS